ncbi:hypothetical protein QYF36_001618 [Acer negundo]|nr:hypothetical protein QYF36_001618 [Acer negundo]
MQRCSYNSQYSKLQNRASRNEIKGLDNVPSSSNQDNQSGKSSGTSRPSENNNNDHDDSPRFISNLMPTPNKEIRDNRVLKYVEGREMEMIDSKNVSSHVQGTRVDILKTEGNSSKGVSGNGKE